MKAKMFVIVLSVAGTILCLRGISTLLHDRSFSETVQGTVDRKKDDVVVVRFHEERSSPAPQKIEFKSDWEKAFPINDRTKPLKVGDTVVAYHPAGRTHEARLDKDGSYLLSGGALVLGGVLILAAGVTVFVCGRTKPR